MKKLAKKILPRKVIKLYKKMRLLKYGEMRVATSISDNQVYPDFCAKASLNSKVFKNFKREYIYNRILEHATEVDGKNYLKKIERNNPNLLNEENIINFKKNDLWGNPRVFNYPQIGNISPSTLRYVNVLEDLIRLKKPMDNSKICEIGVGYGGQCRIINSAFSPQKYTLIDLKPVLMLTQTFLDKFALDTTLKYTTMNELSSNSYDLVISNYAFSELPRNVQDIYINKVILNSEHGYITYNEISPANFKSYNRDELLKIIPNSRIIAEDPIVSKKNCIIIW